MDAKSSTRERQDLKQVNQLNGNTDTNKKIPSDCDF
jgi:hypothetical protein